MCTEFFRFPPLQSKKGHFNDKYEKKKFMLLKKRYLGIFRDIRYLYRLVRYYMRVHRKKVLLSIFTTICLVL